MSREIHNSRWHMHPTVHYSTIYNIHDMEIAELSIRRMNGWMDKEDVVHVYHEIITLS